MVGQTLISNSGINLDLAINVLGDFERHSVQPGGLCSVLHEKRYPGVFTNRRESVWPGRNGTGLLEDSHSPRGLGTPTLPEG